METMPETQDVANDLTCQFGEGSPVRRQSLGRQSFDGVMEIEQTAVLDSVILRLDYNVIYWLVLIGNCGHVENIKLCSHWSFED